MQLSDAWVQQVIDNLPPGTPAAKVLQEALDKNSLAKAVAYVDKETSKLYINRVDPKNPTIAQPPEAPPPPKE